MDSLSDLTEDQIARLSDELDRYLQALEAGEAVDPEDVASDSLTSQKRLTST